MADERVKAAKAQLSARVRATKRRDRAAQLLTRDLDDLPALCGPRELMLAYGIGKSRFYVLLPTGEFDKFMIPGAIGPRKWSGIKLQRWLRGEPIEDTVDARTRRFFGGAARKHA